nr:integrase, catalytic region, zinc finger, CCHC-type, peptidase aspartic, catalytic [Tanacetum cinerariifolium]
MIACLSNGKIDKVIHNVETDIIRLMVEIESFSKSSNEFDKETRSADPSLSCTPTKVEVPKELPKEQGLIIAALKDELRKLKRKALVDTAFTTHTIAPKMLKIDVEPLALRLLKNKTTHSDYLRITQEQAAILKELVKQGKSQNPLNSPLDSAFQDSCQTFLLQHRLYHLQELIWDLLFQPMFDELHNPPPSVDPPAPKIIASIAEVVAPEPAASTGSHSLTTVDQDAPSPSNSQTSHETQSPVISTDVEEENHDLDTLHMNNDTLFGISIPENISEASSSSDVIPTIVHTAAPNSKHINKWTKDHPLDNIIVVEPKTYKDALTQTCWIEAIQKELNEFERLEVWELVPHPDKVMVITLKWIYKTTFLNDILRKEVYVSQPDRFVEKDNLNHVYKLKKVLYGLKQAPHACDPVDTPMVEKSKLDEDPQGKVVDPTYYRGWLAPLCISQPVDQT